MILTKFIIIFLTGIIIYFILSAIILWCHISEYLHYRLAGFIISGVIAYFILENLSKHKKGKRYDKK